MFQHPDLPWMLASPDRRLGVEGVLEIKTVDKDAAGEWDDGPPIHYVCQVWHYFEVLGARFGFIAALIGGNDYREYVIERDDTAIAKIVRIEDVFWNVNVLQDIEPRIVGTEAEARWLGQRYPGNAGDDILLPPDVLDDLNELRRLKAEIKEYEAAERYLENKIKAFMGDATEGIDPAVGADYPVVTWRPQEPMKFDSKAFAERYPHAYQHFKRPSHSRPMLVKEAERPKRKPRKR
jgi:predicted phage-related endonuclease